MSPDMAAVGGRATARFLAVMAGDIYPDLGDLPIASLRLAHILPLFAKIELRGSLTVVHAARGFLGRVFRYAVATEKIELDPCRLCGATHW